MLAEPNVELHVMMTNSCCGGAVPITDVLWSMNCLFLSSSYLKDVWKFSMIVMSLILAISYDHYVYKIKIILIN
jgi:hypothetical protein